MSSVQLQPPLIQVVLKEGSTCEKN